METFGHTVEAVTKVLQGIFYLDDARTPGWLHRRRPSWRSTWPQTGDLRSTATLRSGRRSRRRLRKLYRIRRIAFCFRFQY